MADAAPPPFAPRSGGSAQQPHTLSAESRTAEGLEKRTVKGWGQVVYLSPEAGLSNSDLRGTAVHACHGKG